MVWTIIKYSTSFHQFLGIHTVAKVSDEKTVWVCKNKLAEDGTFDRLFDEFRLYLFLDAGYESKGDIVRRKGMNPIICKKGHRSNPLTDEQKRNNRINSKERCHIEHIFGFIEGAMDGSLVRSIGMIQAKAANALTKLVYNIFRYV